MGMIEQINENAGQYRGASGAGTPKVSISDEIDLSSTGTKKAVMIPIGSFVTKVMLYISDAITAGGTADVDVGDGDDTDRYMDAIGAIATNTLLVAPYPYTVPSATATEATTALTESAGYYYASTDTIDVLVNATSTTGSGRVIVEFFTDSGLA